MIKKIAKVVVLFFLVVLVIFAAEINYIYHNRPEFFSFPYVAIARYYAQKSDFENSASYLSKASRVVAHFNIKRFAINPASFGDKPLAFKEVGSKSTYFTIVKEIKIANLINTQKRDLGEIFYTIAVKTKNEEPTAFAEIMQTAIYLNPQLSAFHVELANYYLTSGDRKNAQQTLEFCQTFNYPKTHCYQYRSNNFDTNSPLPLGFLESEVTNHYRY